MSFLRALQPVRREQGRGRPGRRHRPARTAALGVRIGVRFGEWDDGPISPQVGNVIGGPTEADRNIIVGFTEAGILLAHGAQETDIGGNYIGLTADGKVPAGGSNGHGILLEGHISNGYNFIGGPGGWANWIAGVDTGISLDQRVQHGGRERDRPPGRRHRPGGRRPQRVRRLGPDRRQRHRDADRRVPEHHLRERRPRPDPQLIFGGARSRTTGSGSTSPARPGRPPPPGPATAGPGSRSSAPAATTSAAARPRPGT